MRSRWSTLLAHEEYRERLRHKLREEVAEFLSADDSAVAEELADVLEVVHALALDLGIKPGHLEELRAQKAEARGGFAGRVVWTGNA
ncbi:nucleoside triphosphate pyrophosphohydrolase [Streptomyces sp. NBC_01618]|uniref:nucleoside triphosphate pyrophosphohydrolase n=1 Tax=Streptomyces sp. NBC_01618 TaxID=2975900 RepID=UPI0038682230|nr:nucleoside triphosphate pyrophosphohydrolase [Streptomyces sp. NBC_01618]